jgi:peptidyl-prolyl cis-trans isomerase B (cyclophilin B)
VIPGKRVILPAAVAFLVAACSPEQADTNAEEAVAPPPDSTPTVVFETSMGRIVMELDQSAAPATVNNFLLHVNQKFYDGLIIHRVRDNFMIQMGLLTENFERRLSPVAMLQNEGGNGLSNTRGSVAMAHAADPHTAKTEFYINVKDNPQLDTTEDKWGWCVFGQVIEGMDVVDQIRQVPVRDRGVRESVPIDPIVITAAYVAADESEWANAAESAEGTGGN